MRGARTDFDVVLDEWPGGGQGEALWSLVTSGDVIAVRLPLGFVGLRIVHTQTLMYYEAGRLRIRQVLPAPDVRRQQVSQYRYISGRLEYPGL